MTSQSENADDLPSTDAQSPVEVRGKPTWRTKAVESRMEPPVPAPTDRTETRKERKERLRREAVQELMKRGAAENAAVLLAHEQLRLREEEEKGKWGRHWNWPYVEELAVEVLKHVATALPLADYAEYPGAPQRAGAATKAGIPVWAFYRWLYSDKFTVSVGEEGGEQGERISLRAALARARDTAADALADRHLHLAQVALEQPHFSDAVRVAAEILRWQAMIRAPKRYGDKQDAKPAAGQVVINIGTQAAAQLGRVIDGESSAVLLKDQTQAPDLTG